MIAISSCGKNSAESQNVEEVTSIHAEYPVYDTAKELIDASNLVFSGRVKEIRYESLNTKTETGPDSSTGLEAASAIPYTIFEIEVDQVYKGEANDEIISIKRPGGESDGVFYKLDGASEIEILEDYLFITEAYEKSYPSLLNASQASYKLSNQSSDEEENKAIPLSDIMEYLD